MLFHQGNCGLINIGQAASGSKSKSYKSYRTWVSCPSIKWHQPIFVWIKHSLYLIAIGFTSISWLLFNIHHILVKDDKRWKAYWFCYHISATIMTWFMCKRLFRLDSYFLCPQVIWQQGVKRLQLRGSIQRETKN